jgi:spore germination protein KB
LTEAGKISNGQAAMLSITTLTIMGHLVMLTLIINRSRQDSWIAAIAGAVLGLLGFYVLTKLLRHYPGQTLIEILFQRFSWPGKFAGVCYLIYFYLMAVLGVRIFTEAYKSIMLETPLLAFVTVIVVLTMYIVYLGLETIARMNQILLPFLIMLGILVATLSMTTKDYFNLLPILGNGLRPVLDGSAAVFGWYCEFAVMGMFLPYVKNPEKLHKVNLWAAALTLLFFLGPVTGPVAMFGPTEAAKMVFPTFSEVRYMKVGEVLNRLDSIAVIFWTVGLTMRVSMFYYALALGTAQAFRMERCQPLVIPLGWLIGVGAILFAKNFQELKDFLFHIYVPLNILMGVLLPMLLLLIGMILRKIKKPTG